MNFFPTSSKSIRTIKRPAHDCFKKNISHLILSGTLWVWFASILQFPAKLVPLAPPYSRRKAMAPWVSTDTPLAIRRRGSSLHPWGRTANRALGRPSRPSPDRAGPTANHMCDGVAWPDAHAALKMYSASSCEQYRSRTYNNRARKQHILRSIMKPTFLSIFDAEQMFCGQSNCSSKNINSVIY